MLTHVPTTRDGQHLGYLHKDLNNAIRDLAITTIPIHILIVAAGNRCMRRRPIVCYAIC